MAHAQAELFLDRVESDLDLATRLAAAADRPHMVFALVTEMGFDVTPDEIRNAFLERSLRRLTEHELAAVAAGLTHDSPFVVAGIVGAPPALTGSAAAAV